jgi:hypothetical protein
VSPGRPDWVDRWVEIIKGVVDGREAEPAGAKARRIRLEDLEAIREKLSVLGGPHEDLRAWIEWLVFDGGAARIESRVRDAEHARAIAIGERDAEHRRVEELKQQAWRVWTALDEVGAPLRPKQGEHALPPEGRVRMLGERRSGRVYRSITRHRLERALEQGRLIKGCLDAMGIEKLWLDDHGTMQRYTLAERALKAMHRMAELKGDIEPAVSKFAEAIAEAEDAAAIEGAVDKALSAFGEEKAAEQDRQVLRDVKIGPLEIPVCEVVAADPDGVRGRTWRLEGCTEEPAADPDEARHYVQPGPSFVPTPTMVGEIPNDDEAFAGMQMAADAAGYDLVRRGPGADLAAEAAKLADDTAARLREVAEVLAEAVEDGDRVDLPEKIRRAAGIT